MADTLGGRYTAVKPHLSGEVGPGKLQRLLQNACERTPITAFAGYFANGGSRLLSDFLKGGNQLGNINANHGAFAQTALDIELKIGAVKHA